ncbi:MAG TPA: ribosomal protein S18-alanine N-acetyltransferase [Hyphomicrobiales bacterium]|nr:ribosomal protein S18-alanine N-acetyltransferase [Hyphomicrobiales bacterium]
MDAREFPALRVRPVAVDDHPFLNQQLPALLPGEWSPAALAATSYPQWVLTDTTQDGAIVGFAEVMRVLDECELLGIAVLPTYQGRGFGGVLLREVLRRMRELGCERCHLEVRRSNMAARRLYESVGFAGVGVRRGYYPAIGERAAEDAILYSLSL